jgi:hypothetical protein
VSVALLAVLAASPASGQVRGIYAPGSTLLSAGTLPDFGFSYANDVWANWPTQFKGSRGNDLPVTGVALVAADTSTFTFVPHATIMGAHVEFAVAIALTKDSFLLRDPLLSGPGVSGAATGLTNTNVVPIVLGWQFDRADVQAGYSFYAPTGRFVPGASDNTSTGFWTHAPQAGITFYVTRDKATQVSVFDTYAWNTTQEGTGVQPGQNNSVDYSLSRTFSLSADAQWTLQVGAAGYGQWQTTENRGQLPIREALEYRVNGAGVVGSVTSPFKGFFLSGSVLWEYGARNTYQGTTVTLSGGLTF